MLEEKLTRTLQQYFHHDSFRQGQKEIILDLLHGEDVLGVLQTGGGKSLCYQLPALLLPGLTLVVSPLISLMIDQVRETKALYYKQVAALHSLQSWHERQSILRSLSSYQLLYISPELIQEPRIIQLLQARKVSLFVVDEAHCISQWGHDFRQDYLRLHEVMKQLNDPTLLALTGTATEEVQADIMKQLKRESMKKHLYQIERDNIALLVQKVAGNEEMKLQALQKIIERFHVPTIIYFSSRKKAEEVATFLQGNCSKRKIAYYHGGMDPLERLSVQQQFLHDQISLICSTSAFGMGINKKNIRLIIHYHPPAEVESFIQEIGRAGRDGEQSVSVLLYQAGDIQVPLQLTSYEMPTREEMRHVVRCLENYRLQGLSLPRNLEELTSIFQVNETKWKMLYYHLEASQIIEDNKVVGEQAILFEKAAELWDLMENRLRMKQGKVFDMLAYIESDTCLHEKLYASFASPQPIERENCCMHCHFTLDDWEVTEMMYNEDKQNRDWKELLASKLLVGD